MSAAVETGLWQLDSGASSVTFRHKTMWGLVTVKGAFTSVSGQGEVRADGSAVGSLKLEAASLDTKNAKRDTHLRSADFFDADNHPGITYDVTGAELRDGGEVQVDGELTVRGAARPLSLTARLAESDADAVTLHTEFEVDRSHFGMGWNQLGMMRGLTTVTAALRFTRATS
ncbi:YceI family protein [Streptomyces sp. NPDC050560]|uniref:YceI family protein n=1 Tax=Streptomyces sp. NPDC050560 TaxID=3365630 RepID=UPI003795CD67